ncbi:MAG: hypothetical protein GYB67_10960 [Chloroflexi bacterium]|nr:hypothetical protein [Chloroflexota bacterium]
MVTRFGDNSVELNLPVRLLMQFYADHPAGAADAMLQAPDRDMWVIAQLNSTQVYTITTVDLDAQTSFTRQSVKSKRTVAHRPLPRWARYPAGVVMALSERGLELPGVSAALCGDEPPGPRYEHALGIAVAALWYQVAGKAYTVSDLFGLVDRVHHDYVQVAL